MPARKMLAGVVFLFGKDSEHMKFEGKYFPIEY